MGILEILALKIDHQDHISRLGNFEAQFSVY